MINCKTLYEWSGKIRKCGVTFWKEIQISFYLLSVSGHFRDYGHNQDKCEAQNDRMKYHNCIQKHPLRVSAESTGGIFCGVVFFFYKTKESHVLYIFFITRTTKEKDGGGKSCGIISVLVLAIRGQTLSCCQHRPRNYDYNNITVLPPPLKSLFLQLFSPLVDPPVRSFLSRLVSWKAEP